MAFTFWLNGRHDLEIRSGKLRLVYGADEVKQRILVALLHGWNEYFLDVPDGVPWYEVILGSKDKKMVELLLRRKILEVPGVIGIASMSVQFANATRQLEIYGTVEVQGYEGTPAVITLAFAAEGVEGATNEFAAVNVPFAGINWQFA